MAITESGIGNSILNTGRDCFDHFRRFFSYISSSKLIDYNLSMKKVIAICNQIIRNYSKYKYIDMQKEYVSLNSHQVDIS